MPSKQSPTEQRGGLGAYQAPFLTRVLSKKAQCSDGIAFETERTTSSSRNLSPPTYKYPQSFLGRISCTQWGRLASHPTTRTLTERILTVSCAKLLYLQADVLAARDISSLSSCKNPLTLLVWMRGITRSRSTSAQALRFEHWFSMAQPDFCGD
jgi:hypothetical protein